MAPPDPQRLALLDALRERLKGITDPARYHFPLTAPDYQVSADATLNLLTANSDALPLYVIEPTPEGDKAYYPACQLRENFVVNIHGRMDADESDPASRQRVWERMAADLETAIADDPTFGGLVQDATLGVVMPFVGIGSPVVLIAYPITFRFWRRYGRP